MGAKIEQRLNLWLASVQDKPFQWHTWDCFQFTNAGWRAMHGQGWADDWAGRYMARGLYMRRDALRQEFGFATLEDALAARLRPVLGIPPRGALVTTDQAQRWVIGAALGLSLGTRAAFVGKSGVVTLPIDCITGAYCAK